MLSIYFKKNEGRQFNSNKLQHLSDVSKSVVINVWKRIFIGVMRIKILKNIVKRHFFSVSLLRLLEKEKNYEVWMNLWLISYQIMRPWTCLIMEYCLLKSVDLLSIMILVIWKCLRTFLCHKIFRIFS